MDDDLDYYDNRQSHRGLQAEAVKRVEKNIRQLFKTMKIIAIIVVILMVLVVCVMPIQVFHLWHGIQILEKVDLKDTMTSKNFIEKTSVVLILI